MKATIAANAAAKSRALELFATDCGLEGGVLFGPEAHTRRKMRRINGKARGMSRDLSNRMQIDFLPNVNGGKDVIKDRQQRA